MDETTLGDLSLMQPNATLGEMVLSRRHPLVFMRMEQVLMECLIWLEIPGNGVRIGILRITIKIALPIILQGQRVQKYVLSAEAHGGMTGSMGNVLPGIGMVRIIGMIM